MAWRYGLEEAIRLGTNIAEDGSIMMPEGVGSSGRSIAGAGVIGSIPVAAAQMYGLHKGGLHNDDKQRKERNDKGKSREPIGRTAPTLKKLADIKEILKKSGINNKNLSKNNTPNIDNIHRSINTGLHGMATQANNELEIKPIPKSLSSIIPDYFTIRLPVRSIDLFSIVPTVGNYDGTRISLNDLNSTFAHATTLDFLGLSQWKALFQYYRIISGKVEIDMHNATSTVTTDTLHEFVERYSIEPTDSSTVRYTTARQMCEAKHNITGLLYPTAYGSEKFQKTIEYNYNPKQFLETNGHVAETGDEDTWNPIAGSPAHPHYLHVGACLNNVNGFSAATPGIVIADIKYEIIVQFRETTDSILTTSQTT